MTAGVRCLGSESLRFLRGSKALTPRRLHYRRGVTAKYINAAPVRAFRYALNYASSDAVLGHARLCPWPHLPSDVTCEHHVCARYMLTVVMRSPEHFKLQRNG